MKQSQNNPIPGISKMWSVFLLSSKVPVLGRIFIDIIHISGDFESTTKADHILEKAGLGLFCGHSFLYNICKIGLKDECRKLFQRGRNCQ